jgi:hypothetical protein
MTAVFPRFGRFKTVKVTLAELAPAGMVTCPDGLNE